MYLALRVPSVFTQNSLRLNEVRYYNLPYPSNGLTVMLNLMSGRIVCYASISARNPNQFDYTWKFDTSGTNIGDIYLDPTSTYVYRPRVFISLAGLYYSRNVFNLTITRGGTPAQGK